MLRFIDVKKIKAERETQRLCVRPLRDEIFGEEINELKRIVLPCCRSQVELPFSAINL